MVASKKVLLWVVAVGVGVAVFGMGAACQAGVVAVFDGGPDGTGTSWDVDANWSGDLKPGAGDGAEFTTDGSGTVPSVLTLDADQLIQYLLFDSSTSMSISSAASGTTARSLTLGGADANGNLISLGARAVNSTLTFDTAHGNANIVLGAAGNIDVAGAAATLQIQSELSGSAAFTKTGAGTLALTGANTAYTGAVTIARGGVVLSGADGALRGGSSAISLTSGGSLTLLNTAAANQGDRLANGLTAAGGTLNFTHAGGAADYSEDLGGPLTVNSGQLHVNLSQADAGRTSAVTAASLARAAGGTAVFSGAGLGSDTRNQLLVTTAPTVSNGILPWAVITSDGGTTYNFATHSGVVGASLAAQTTYETGGESTWTANTVNARPTATQSPDANRTLNSLVLDNNVNLGTGSASPTADRTITLGANGMAGILQSGGSSTIAPNGTSEYILAFGTNEAILHVMGTLTFLRNAANVITGSAGVTKTGTGTLVLGDAANGFGSANTGPFTVNEGTVRVVGSGAASLGTGTATLVLNAGRLELAHTAGVNYARNTTVNGESEIVADRPTSGAGQTFTLGTLAIGRRTLTVSGGANVTSGTAGVTFGNTTLSGSTTFEVTKPTAGGDTMLTLGALTGGSYKIQKTGSGALKLGSAATSWNGTMQVDAGALVLGNNTALGSASVLLAAGTNLAASANVTFSNAVTIDSDVILGQTSGNTGTMALTGPITLAGNRSLKFFSGTTFSSPLGEDTPGQGLTLLAGSTSTLTFGGSSANTYTGTTTVNGGTLTLSKTADVASILGPLVIGDGTGGDTVSATTAGQFGGNPPVTINTNGTLTLSAAANQSIGSLTMVGGTVTTNTAVLTLNGPLSMSPAGATSSIINASVIGGGVVLDGDITATSAPAAAGYVQIIGPGNLSLRGISRTFTANSGAGTTAASDLSVAAAIIDGGAASSLTKAGSGTVTLSGASTFSGGTILSTGLLAIGSSSTPSTEGAAVTSGPVGTGVLSLGAATFAASSSTARTIANAVHLDGNTIFGRTTTFTGPLTLNGPATLTGDRSLTFNVATTFGSSIGEDVAGRNFLMGGGANATATFAGATANTYTGTTTVNGGTLALSKTADVASILGPLVIGDGTGSDAVNATTAGQFGGNPPVTINVNGALTLSAGANQSIGSLTMIGGTVTTNTGILTLNGALSMTPSGATSSIINASVAGGGLVLDGDITVTSAPAAAGYVQINGAGNLSLRGTNRIFTANPGAGTTATSDLTVAAAVIDGGVPSSVTKSGSGTLTLSGAGAFSGGMVLDTGTLVLGANSTPSTEGATVTSGPVGTGILSLGTATVAANAARTIANAVRLDGNTIFGKTATFTSAMTFNGPTTLTGDRSLTFNVATTFGSSIGEDAAGRAFILGGGANATVTYAGATANTYTGTTTVNGGTLALSKTADVASIVGPLVIGDGTGADAVNSTTAGQFGGNPPVTINVNGALTLSAGANQSIGALTMIGGTITTNTGILTLNGPLSMTPSGATSSIINASVAAGGLVLDGDISVTSAPAAAGYVQINGLGSLSLRGINRIFTANPGAATTATSDLSVSAVVIDGGAASSLTKAGSGTLTLSGASTYSGGTVLNAGTLVLGVNSNPSTEGAAVTNGPVGTGTLAIGAATIAANAARTIANPMRLDGNAVFGRTTTFTSTLAFNGPATLTGDRSLTFNVATTFGSSIGEDVAGRSFIMGGGANANATFAGTAANTYTGTTTVNGGTLALSKTAEAASILGPLVIGDGTGTDAVNATTAGQFGSNPPVTINVNGALTLSAGANQNIGALTMIGGTVTTNTATLTLHGPLSVTASGGTSSIVNASVAAGSLVLGGDATATSAAGAAGYVQINGPGSLGLGGANRLLTVEHAAGSTAASDLTIAAPIVDAGASALLTKAGSGTLTLSGAGTFSGGFDLSNGALHLGLGSTPSTENAVVTSGPVGTGTFGLGTATVASSSNTARALANALHLDGNATFGKTTTYTGTLSFNGPATLTGDRSLAFNVATTFGSGIGEDFLGRSLTIGGGANANVTFAGGTANTYTGTTTVNGGTLFLSKTADVASIAGALVIGDGTGSDAVNATTAGQFANHPAVTINPGGALTLSAGANQSIGALTMISGTVTTNTGLLTLGGPLSMTASGATSSIVNASVAGGAMVLGGGFSATSAAGAAGYVQVNGPGNLGLGGAARTFLVEHGAASTATSDLTITAPIVDAGAASSLTKAGTGTMTLSGAGTFSGGTVLADGTLLLGLSSTPSTEGAAVTSGPVGTGTLSLGAATIASNSSTARAFGNAVRLDGNTTFGKTTTFTGTLAFNGPATLTGDRSLTFNVATTFGSGMGEDLAGRAFTMGGGANANVTFSGASPNIYTGTTTVNGGTLFLSKTVDAASIAGPLVIGDGTGSDAVNATTAGQFANQPPVTVNLGAALTLSAGANQSIGALIITGATVTTNTGILTLGGPLSMTASGATNSIVNASVAAGSLVLGGDVTATSAAGAAGYVQVNGPGSLGLGGANRVLTVERGVDSTAAVDMTISAPIVDGPASASLTKSGSGTLSLSGAGTYSGGTVFSSGLLLLGLNSTPSTEGAAVTSGPVGTGLLSLGAVNLTSASGTARTLANALSLDGDATFGRTTTYTGTLAFNGPTTLTDSRSLTFNVATTFGSAIGENAPGRGFTMGGGANANVTFAGNAPNTYTGTTTVNGGTLYLSKTAGSASIAGPLVIGDGSGSDVVNPTTAGQFANQPPVTINVNGTLSLSGGANQSIGTLTMTGGTVTTSSGILTLNGPLSMTAVGSGNSTVNISSWNGQFVLGGDVTAVSAAAGSGYVRVIGSGNFGLGGADRTFTVDPGAGTTAASDMLIQVPIVDAGAGASLTKAGSGTLRLEGYNSTYTGGTKVLAGVLVIRNNSYVTRDGALGTGPLTLGTATLAGDPAGWSPYTVENPLTLNGDTTFGQTSVNTSGFSFTGGAGLTGTRQLTVNVPVSISGGMTGGASGFGFTKGGSAGLTVYAAAGTNVGSIVIAGGTLEAIGNGALAGTGTITVNGGTTFRSRGTANYDKTYGDHSILVRSGGTLSITSTSYTGPQIWSGLSFESGAVVDVGSVGNTTQVFDTSLVALPSAGVMTFTGMGTDELKVAGNWPQLTGDLEIAASGTRPVRLYGTFTEAGAGRKLTKSGGGEFYYSTPFAPGHSGGTEITGGSLVWQYSGGPGTLSFGAAGGSPTAIRLSSGGGFSLDTAAMTSAGEFSVDNPIVVHGSGQLGFATSEGRFPRTTGDLMLQGQLTASFDTGYAPASHYVVANTIRIDQSGPGPRSIVIRSSYSHVQLPISISGPIIDDGAAVLNGLIIDNSDSYVPLNITGAGNTYAGGTTIAGSPFGAPLVSVQPGSSLGTGNVEVGSGAQLQLTEPANLAPGAAVNLVSDAQALAVLGLAYDGPPTMLSPNSSGVLALDVPVYTHTIDMASLGDGAMRLGSTGNGEYQSGTLGASGGKYRLGGCDGTLTLSAANVLTGPNAVEVGSELVNGWGTVALTAANDYSGGTTVNTALVLGASGAMGSGPVTVADGAELDFLSRAQAHGNDITFQRAGWLWVPQPGTDVSLDGKVDLAGDQGALLVETESVISLTGTLALGNSYLDVYGSGVLALNTISTTGDGDVWVDIGAGLAFTTPSALPAGHLYSHGGVFVLDGLSWASFTSARSYGPGPNQWEFSSARGGGFAARSTPLVIDSTPAGFSWDRDFTLGSDVRTGTGASASYYADQPVILAQNVVLSSEQRTITVAGNGPGLTGRAGTGAAHVLSGNLTGPGSLTWNANTDTAELVLAGTNNAWTGASYVAAVDYDFSAGLGGLVNARGNGFVRFDGNASLPKGNAGNPAYLAAIGSVFAGTAPAEFGYLLTARPGGAAYNLPSGYRFLFGGVQYTDAQPGTLGSTSADGNAGSATLRKSDVLVTADPSYLLGSSELHLLVRDGTLVLGTTPPGAADGPVRFVPVLAQYESSWRDENSPATPVSDNPAAFQLVKRGVGTLVLQDVRYTNLAGAADTSGQFTWTLGTGVAEGFGGAVRETGAAAGDSLSGNPGLKIKMRGGVVELGGGDFTLLPGTGPHEVDMSEGGGFAAHGATRTVNLGGLEPDPATMVWNADSVGSFVNSDAPLVFGSLTANDKVLFVNPIELNGGMRSIASVHGEEPEAAAELSGDISGGTGAGLVFGALNAPWGEPLPAGTIVLSGTNTYLGGTVVNAGTLVAGNVNALPGGGAITVAAGATAALAIDMNLGAGHAAAVRSAAVQPVPEPATLVLLLAGVVCVLAWIGRRRARSCSAA